MLSIIDLIEKDKYEKTASLPSSLHHYPRHRIQIPQTLWKFGNSTHFKSYCRTEETLGAVRPFTRLNNIFCWVTQNFMMAATTTDMLFAGEANLSFKVNWPCSSPSACSSETIVEAGLTVWVCLSDDLIWNWMDKSSGAKLAGWTQDAFNTFSILTNNLVDYG